MNKFHTYRVLMLILIIVIVAGCSKSATTKNDSAAPQKSEMVIAVNENFITMDPHNSGDRNTNSVQMAMLEGLVSEQDGKIVPLLAEEYLANSTGTEFTFKLRKGVKFHDGTPFNAEAVKVNFERIADKKNGLRLYSRGFNDIKSIEISDEYNIKITLNNPNSSFLPKIVPATIISPKVFKEGDVTKKPVGTGPYKFVDWVQGDHLTLELNKDYWNKENMPKVTKITYKPVPENGARVAMLKTGEADIIYPLPVQNISELEKSKGVVVKKTDSTIIRYVTLNTMKKPFNDVRVRQALNYATNKDAYISVVMAGLASSSDSNIPKTVDYYQQQKLYEFNINKAKELLKEAGYENGFKATIWGNSNSDTQKGMQFIQQQLSQIGVQLEVVSMEEGTLSDKIYGGVTPEKAEVQMWYVSWGSQASDTDNAIKPILGGMSFPPGGGNASYYSNPDVDKWLIEANATSDKKKKQELYNQIQSTIYKDAPWIFLASDLNVSGQRDNLDGVYITPHGRINVQKAAFK